MNIIKMLKKSVPDYYQELDLRVHFTDPASHGPEYGQLMEYLEDGRDIFVPAPGLDAPFIVCIKDF